MKNGNDNFMTEKEKNFVSFCLAKNIKRPPKYFDYSVFFRRDSFEMRLPVYKKSEVVKPKDYVEKREGHRQRMKELLQTSLHRTVRKSRKSSRSLGSRNLHKMSDRLQICLKIESLFYCMLCLKYGLRDRFSEDIKEGDDVNGVDTSIFLLSEVDFIDCILIPKFFSVLSDIFVHVSDDFVKRTYIFLLSKYSWRILLVDEFLSFVNASCSYFPSDLDPNSLHLDFYSNFFCSVCSVSFGHALIEMSESFAFVMFRYLCNENLDLVFSLDNDRVAWQFIASLVKPLDDAGKSLVVSFIKERVVETLHQKNEETIRGLNCFLDAIGIDHVNVE